MSKPNNPAAFPIQQQYDNHEFCVASHQPGLSMRDYFAAGVLNALSLGAFVVAASGKTMTPGYSGTEGFARAVHDAYELADAMLLERAK